MAMKISKKAQKGINRGVSLGYTGVEETPVEKPTKKMVKRPTMGIFKESDFAWGVFKLLLAKGRTEEEARVKALKIVTGDEKEENLPAIIKFIGGDTDFWVKGLVAKYPTIAETLEVSDTQAKAKAKQMSDATKEAKRQAFLAKCEKEKQEATARNHRDAEAIVNKTIRQLQAKQRAKAKKAERKMLKKAGCDTMEEYQAKREEILVNDLVQAGFKVKGL